MNLIKIAKCDVSRCYVEEIIDNYGESRHLSIILLKNFNLFKIIELVINFCLSFFSN